MSCPRNDVGERAVDIPCNDVGGGEGSGHTTITGRESAPIEYCNIRVMKQKSYVIIILLIKSLKLILFGNTYV